MKNKQFHELAVCGMDSVKSIERRHPEKIRRLYFTREKAPLFGGLCKKLAQTHIPYNCVADEIELEKLSGTVHHQGVVAMIDMPLIENFSRTRLAEIAADKKPVVYLDNVKNANNIGAIVRSAAFFGFFTLLLPDDIAEECVTTSTYRIARGAMEFMDIYRVSMILRLINDAKDDFCVVGCDVHSRENFSQIGKFCGEKTPFIILGNEENGIGKEIRDVCDALLKINGFSLEGAGPAVESLNVAQAASIAFYETSYFLRVRDENK